MYGELFDGNFQTYKPEKILQELMVIAVNLAKSLPDVIDGKSRRQYRIDNLEKFSQ